MAVLRENPDKGRKLSPEEREAFKLLLKDLAKVFILKALDEHER